MRRLIALSAAQEESEYETDSEDEGAGRRLLKPVFVPKLAREVGRGLRLTCTKTGGCWEAVGGLSTKVLSY